MLSKEIQAVSDASSFGLTTSFLIGSFLIINRENETLSLIHKFDTKFPINQKYVSVENHLPFHLHITEIVCFFRFQFYIPWHSIGNVLVILRITQENAMGCRMKQKKNSWRMCLSGKSREKNFKIILKYV